MAQKYEVVPQAQLFYDTFWDATTDAIFIDYMSGQAKFCNFTPGEDNTFAFNIA